MDVNGRSALPGVSQNLSVTTSAPKPAPPVGGMPQPSSEPSRLFDGDREFARHPNLSKYLLRSEPTGPHGTLHRGWDTGSYPVSR